MPYQEVYTSLDQILLAAQTQITGAGNFQPTQVVMSIKPDAALQSPVGDQFVVISPGKQMPDKPIRIGAGRVQMLFHGEFLVTLWTRLSLDRLPFDDEWLTNLSLGSLTQMNNVINVLELYQPLDTHGNWLSPIGYELEAVQMYSKEVDKVGWGAIEMLWSIQYVFLLNPPTVPVPS